MSDQSTFLELLYVQTSQLAVTIKGNASHPSFPGISFDEKEASLHIESDEEYQLTLSGEYEPICLESIGKAYIGRYRHTPLFFEQQRYEIIVEPEPGHIVEFWHDNYNLRKNISPVGRKSSILSGIINFGNEIGLSDLVFIVDGHSVVKITVEVFPSKISYKEDYKAIVTDVTTEVYNLVFDFLKKTYEGFDVSEERKSSPVEFFAIITRIYNEMIKAVDMVISKPHHLLAVDHEILPEHKIKKTDQKTIRWLEGHPDQIVKHNGNYHINKALAVRKYVTYDTKENQLAKYMIVSTAKRLESFKKQYACLQRESDPGLISRLDAMISGLNRRSNSGIMREVKALPNTSGMSLVFSMAPGYRDLHRYYLLLQHGLSVTGSIFNISIKDLAVLYEYWCFIKLNSLMRQKYKLISQDILKVSGNGLLVTLVKGKKSQVKYLNPDNGEIITLSYNKSYSNMDSDDLPDVDKIPTVAQKPDNILQLRKNGVNNYEFVFDAKYRINPAEAGSYYYNHYLTPGPQEDDINTMHRYRDAIVYQNDAHPFERTVFGAYVLFPYSNESEYRNHHFYKSIEQVNIGGLPFLPSATELVTQMLDELISDSPESAFERATLPDGIEERLKKVDWTVKDVLIGFVDSDEQMQICRGQNYYYTYTTNIASDKLPIRYIALYRKNTGIEYFGKVILTQEVSRSEIPGHARWKDRTCYRFDVKEWNRLPVTIRPELYGPNPIAYTNYFLLTHSSTYPELHFRSEAEYRFFTEIKRRTDKAVIEEPKDCSGFEMGNARIVFDADRIILICNGIIEDECTIGDFSRKPNAVFRRLTRRLQLYNDAFSSVKKDE